MSSPAARAELKLCSGAVHEKITEDSEVIEVIRE